MLFEKITSETKRLLISMQMMFINENRLKQYLNLPSRNKNHVEINIKILIMKILMPNTLIGKKFRF